RWRSAAIATRSPASPAAALLQRHQQPTPDVVGARRRHARSLTRIVTTHFAGVGPAFTYFGSSPFAHGSYVCANTSRCASGGCEYSQNVISPGGFGSANPISPRI